MEQTRKQIAIQTRNRKIVREWAKRVAKGGARTVVAQEIADREGLTVQHLYSILKQEGLTAGRGTKEGNLENAES